MSQSDDEHNEYSTFLQGCEPKGNGKLKWVLDGACIQAVLERDWKRKVNGKRSKLMWRVILEWGQSILHVLSWLPMLTNVLCSQEQCSKAQIGLAHTCLSLSSHKVFEVTIV